MATIHFSALRALPVDRNGNVVPVIPGIDEAPYTDTSFATSETWTPTKAPKFFRMANDVAVYIDRSGGAAATTADEWFPAGERVLELPQGVTAVQYIAA